MARARNKSNLSAARARMYRELVFDCAERVFAEQGFDDSTMQDIAAEAGISLKTLYAAYPGKNELDAEIHAVRGGQFIERVAREADGSGTPLERMARSVRAYVEFLLEHESYARILLREGRAWGLGPAFEADPRWREGLRLFAGLLREGMEEGVFYDGDAELMAASGLAIMQVQMGGLLRQSRHRDAASVSDEILLQLRRLYCPPPVDESDGSLAA